jgi:HNH endonuclease
MPLKLDKLFSRVNFNGPIPSARPDLGPCWIWLGPKDKDGYGRVKFDGKTQRVHRVMHTLIKGDIPEGREPDHLCRIRVCCNPDHTEIVSTRENILRSDGPAARNARKTRCKNGHPLVEENLVLSCLSSGRRRCLTCRRAYSRRWWKKKQNRLGRQPIKRPRKTADPTLEEVLR